MIHARIRVPGNGYPEHSEETADESYAELLRLAWEKAVELELQVIRVEVEYLDPETGEYPDWEVSGDAVEIDFTSGIPVVTTLPPYEEVTP